MIKTILVWGIIICIAWFVFQGGLIDIKYKIKEYDFPSLNLNLNNATTQNVQTQNNKPSGIVKYIYEDYCNPYEWGMQYAPSDYFADFKRGICKADTNCFGDKYQKYKCRGDDLVCYCKL